MSHVTRAFSLPVSEFTGEVDALLLRPEQAKWLLVLAHGAGAGMQHSFMERVAGELAACRVATLRYQFPYMQHRRGRPDAPAMLTDTVLAAITAASELAPDLPLLAGGKSLGGRMTSIAVAGVRRDQNDVLARLQGLVFFGFPLHPPGRPGIERAQHLARIDMPMLFLQGTRDALADLSLLRPICAELGTKARLHVIEGADHSFRVLKRYGKTDADVLCELAGAVTAWAASL